MNYKYNRFPVGVKVGDFIQLESHFPDVFFQVDSVYPPQDDNHYWSIGYITHNKQLQQKLEFVNGGCSAVSRVVPEEFAIPTMISKNQRYHTHSGMYDPIFGWQPAVLCGRTS